MGIDTMYYAIHAFGLAELLKSGAVSNVDDEHYWDLIDNTYVDDVRNAFTVVVIKLLMHGLGQRSDARRSQFSL